MKKYFIFIIGILIVIGGGYAIYTQKLLPRDSVPTATLDDSHTAHDTTTPPAMPKSAPPAKPSTDTTATASCLVGTWAYASGMENISEALSDSLGGDGPAFHYNGKSGHFTMEITPEGFDAGIYNAQYRFDDFTLRYGYNASGVPIDVTIVINGLQPFEIQTPHTSQGGFTVIPGEHSLLVQAFMSLAPDRAINLDNLPRGFISGGTFRCTDDKLSFTFQTYTEPNLIHDLTFSRSN